MGAWDIMGREYNDEATVGAALQRTTIRATGQSTGGPADNYTRGTDPLGPGTMWARMSMQTVMVRQLISNKTLFQLVTSGQGGLNVH